MAEVRVLIGGVLFHFQRDAFPPIVSACYHPFLVCPVPLSVAPVDVGATYEVVDVPCDSVEHAASHVLWRGATWQIHGLCDGLFRVVAVDARTGEMRTTALVTDGFSSGRIFPLDTRTGAPSACVTQYPTDRVVIANRLAHLGRIVLHASGVVMKDRAVLFCGHSQVGKSTLADICQRTVGAVLLNDDRMIAGVLGGRAMAGAAPWHGKDPRVRTGAFPLGAVFHLSQASETRLKKIRESTAVARLIATSAAPFYNPEAMATLTEAVAEMTEHVDSYDLAFAPDADVAERVLSVL